MALLVSSAQLHPGSAHSAAPRWRGAAFCSTCGSPVWASTVFQTGTPRTVGDAAPHDGTTPESAATGTVEMTTRDGRPPNLVLVPEARDANSGAESREPKEGRSETDANPSMSPQSRGLLISAVGCVAGLTSVLFMPWSSFPDGLSCHALFGGYCQYNDSHTNAVFVALIAAVVIVGIRAIKQSGGESSSKALIGCGVGILLCRIHTADGFSSRLRVFR